jgi:hypothetical protein
MISPKILLGCPKPKMFSIALLWAPDITLMSADSKTPLLMNGTIETDERNYRGHDSLR